MRRKKIRGPLTLATVAQHRATFLEGEGSPLWVDLGAVDELDTAGLQLLLAAHRRRGLRVEGASAAVLEVFRLLRLEEHFLDSPARER